VQDSIPLLNSVLEISCNVISASCNALTQSYAAALKDPSNCGTDLQQQNQMVLRAYNGFLSYQPIYSAACLQVDPKTVSTVNTTTYCFVDAANNTVNSADMSLYYVALGVPLPGGSLPSCSSCTQQTMAIFAEAAQNLTSPLSQDYMQTATIINQNCGPTFVNSSVKPIAGSGSSGAALLVAPGIGVLLWTALIIGGVGTVLF
jgi:hypothetical protein